MYRVGLRDPSPVSEEQSNPLEGSSGNVILWVTGD